MHLKNLFLYNYSWFPKRNKNETNFLKKNHIYLYVYTHINTYTYTHICMCVLVSMNKFKKSSQQAVIMRGKYIGDLVL